MVLTVVCAGCFLLISGINETFIDRSVSRRPRPVGGEHHLDEWKQDNRRAFG